MNVDCRCDGAEMSVRNQRVGTSHSDRVKEVCRNRVLHNVAIQTYTFRYERSDELGGMAVNLLGILEWRRENTVRLNCCFDSAINLLGVPSIFNTTERIQVSHDLTK